MMLGPYFPICWNFGFQMIGFLKVSQGTKNWTSCRRRSHSTCKLARTWRAWTVWPRETFLFLETILPKLRDLQFSVAPIYPGNTIQWSEFTKFLPRLDSWGSPAISEKIWVQDLWNDFEATRFSQTNQAIHPTVQSRPIFLRITTHKYPLCRAYIGISHRGTLVGVLPTIPWFFQDHSSQDFGAPKIRTTD